MWHTTCGRQDSRCPFSYAILNAFFLRHNDAMFMFDKHLIFAENKTLGFGTHTHNKMKPEVKHQTGAKNVS